MAVQLPDHPGNRIDSWDLRNPTAALRAHQEIDTVQNDNAPIDKGRINMTADATIDPAIGPATGTPKIK